MRVPGARVAEQGERRRRLAAARLADQPEDLAGAHLERDVLDDRHAVAQLDAQPLDAKRGRLGLRAVRSCAGTDGGGRDALRPGDRVADAGSRRSSAARSSAPGANTAHGLSVRPARFSLIISAQSAAGGCRPRPRKLTEATRMIEHVRRRPASAMTGGTMFGRISRRRIDDGRARRARPPPRRSARTDCSSVAVRTMRAIGGICTIATPSDERAVARARRPSRARAGRAAAGTASSTSTDAHQQRRRAASACSRRRGRSRAPHDVGEERREPGQREHAAPAPEHARQHVAAEAVGAERARRARALVRQCRSAARADAARSTARRARRARTSASSDRRRSRHAGAGAREARAGSLIAAVRSFGTSRTTSRSATMLSDDVDGRDQHRDRLHGAHVADRDRVDELLAEARDRRRGTRRR